MRSLADQEKLRDFMAEIGCRAKGPGRIYFTGGASALLLGIRHQTVALDIKLDPEPAGVFEAIAELKNDLDLSVELAAPDDFLPPLPDWRERSLFIARAREVEFFHYDFYGQALSKLLRGHEKDLDDVDALHSLRLIETNRLMQLFAAIQDQLIRYPAINCDEFRRRVEEFSAKHRGS